MENFVIKFSIKLIRFQWCHSFTNTILYEHSFQFISDISYPHFLRMLPFRLHIHLWTLMFYNNLSALRCLWTLKANVMNVGCWISFLWPLYEINIKNFIHLHYMQCIINPRWCFPFFMIYMTDFCLRISSYPNTKLHFQFIKLQSIMSELRFHIFNHLSSFLLF